MEFKPESEVTESDILDFAIDTERHAAQAYLAAADCAKDKKAEALLLELANEERDHETKLSALKGKVEARDSLENKLEPGYLAKTEQAFGKISLPKATTTEGALKYGIERETAMLELYEVFSHLISGGAFKPLLNYLVEEERMHLRKLEQMLANNEVEAE